MYAKILKTVARAFFLLVVLVFAGIFSVIVYSAVIYPMYLESQADIGMDKQEVLANLEGKKYRVSDSLSLCENNAWYGDCEAANESGSVEFLMLKTGIDMWLVVGFDSEGKVSFVGRGDT